MNRATTALMLSLPAAVLALATACGEPVHLGWDYGRAYVDAFTMQSDLTRPSVAASQYQLSGNEAAQIRLRAEQATTDQESGETEGQ
jgi:hypothetical protein